jgi:hypothetical protein
LEHGDTLGPQILAMAASARPLSGEEQVVIRCVGHEFLTRISMAKIFLRRSEEVIAEGGSELVPLLHEGGIELLAVTRFMPITVTDVGPEYSSVSS